jgi:hypothetical protein
MEKKTTFQMEGDGYFEKGVFLDFLKILFELLMKL